MKIPKFLYVPRVKAQNKTKLVQETNVHAYWEVIEFESRIELHNWVTENSENLPDNVLTITAHKEYPIILLCIGVEKEIKTDKLVELGKQASDWYVDFYLRNKKLSEPIFNEKENFSDKVKEYFKHWRWGDNLISHNGEMTLINLAYGLAIHFNYGDVFFASFEDFESEITDIQFINGERPDEAKIHKLIIDAWNFMSIQERIENGFEIEKLDEDSIF